MTTPEQAGTKPAACVAEQWDRVKSAVYGPVAGTKPAEPCALETFRQAVIARGRPKYGGVGTRDVDVAADMKLYDAAVAVKPSPEPAVAEPTAKALEFAEYMAQGAEHLMTCINAYAKVVEQVEQGYDLDISTPESDQQWIEKAQQHVTDAATGLRSGVYEFRKRRDRAAKATP